MITRSTRAPLIAIGTHAFLNAWSEYLYALLLLTGEPRVTLPVAMLLRATLFLAGHGQLERHRAVCNPRDHGLSRERLA